MTVRERNELYYQAAFTEMVATDRDSDDGIAVPAAPTPPPTPAWSVWTMGRLRVLVAHTKPTFALSSQVPISMSDGVAPSLNDDDGATGSADDMAAAAGASASASQDAPDPMGSAGAQQLHALPWAKLEYQPQLIKEQYTAMELCDWWLRQLLCPDRPHVLVGTLGLAERTRLAHPMPCAKGSR